MMLMFCAIAHFYGHWYIRKVAALHCGQDADEHDAKIEEFELSYCEII